MSNRMGKKGTRGAWEAKPRAQGGSVVRISYRNRETCERWSRIEKQPPCSRASVDTSGPLMRTRPCKWHVRRNRLSKHFRGRAAEARDRAALIGHASLSIYEFSASMVASARFADDSSSSYPLQGCRGIPKRRHITSRPARHRYAIRSSSRWRTVKRCHALSTHCASTGSKEPRLAFDQLSSRASSD